MTLTNNFNGTAIRWMVFRNIQNYKTGDILTGMVHWTNGGDYCEWDLDCSYCYEFKCENLKGHKIDYLKLDEYNVYEEDSYDVEYANLLDNYGVNIDCIEEKEVLVDSSVKFRIVSIESNTEKDFNTADDDCNYICQITVEII